MASTLRVNGRLVVCRYGGSASEQGRAAHARELMADQPPGHADSDGAGEQGHQPATGERTPRGAVRQRVSQASPALKFVLMVGVMSFFADFTYEGSRSVIGPYLGTLGVGALGISIITGAGEFLGYGLRLFSGRGADKTGRYWPITISGYVVQMAAVPLLALAGSWQLAALLIILERVGKATRNPPRDAMLSHAAKEMGYGWGFGVHEALDQFGAMFGPLLVALILAVSQHDYQLAFASLAVPAVIMLSLLMIARRLYPRLQDLSAGPAEVTTSGLPRVFWVYLAGAALVAAGFADFPLIAFHFQQARTMSAPLVPVFYAVAMAVSGTGSLIFGRLFDRSGIGILIPLTVVAAAYAPLVFLGGFWPSLVGVSLWGLGMGVNESIIPAAVAPMVSPDRRASAYGLFTGAYGTAWMLGSIAIGALFDVSLVAVAAFAVAAQLAAIPFIVVVRRRTAGGGARAGHPG
jgi:MFS family permease